MPNARVPAAVAANQLPTLEQPWQAEAIDASHQRCAGFGLAQSVTPEFSGPALGAWRCALEQSERLRHNAIPIMGMLYQQITRSRSMVVLTDEEGLIIETVGDDDFLESAQKVALANGVNWSESEKGTNAIGTAIADNAPTLVHGRQHYLEVNHFLTCSAAPIHGPAGDVVGVLDVTGNERSYHQHTMALVNMSTTMIENNLVDNALTDGLRISFHRRPEFLSTLAEAIVCVDPDGQVTGSNSVARREYGIAVDPTRVTNLADLVGLSVSALRDLASVNVHQPVRLYVDEQTAVFARIEFYGQPVTRVSGIDASGHRPAAVKASVTANSDPLSDLDTGDKAVNRVINRVRKVVNHPLALLILGPSGAGKRRLASAVHQCGFADGPLVLVSGASPHSDDPIDWFDKALGGTLLIGDVDQLSESVQARLEAVVLSPEYDASQARLICTASNDLKSCARAGSFRRDLYHEINGLTVSLPLLSERTDLRQLIRLILTSIDETPNPVSDPVYQLFADSGWPGNLRQLKQLLTSACALAGPGVELRVEHLPEDFIEPTAPPKAASAPDLKSVTDAVIERVLKEHGGNVSSAARELGVSRNTIYRHRRTGTA